MVHPTLVVIHIFLENVLNILLVIIKEPRIFHMLTIPSQSLGIESRALQTRQVLYH